MTREEIKIIIDIVHKTIYGFFDVCGDDEETPMTDKDKLLLKVNKAICNNIKALEQEPKWIPVSERLPKIADVYRVTRYYPNNVMNPEYLVDACFFDGSNTWYNDNRINHERAYANNVIAWQENPEPYEPQESEV